MSFDQEQECVCMVMFCFHKKEKKIFFWEEFTLQDQGTDEMKTTAYAMYGLPYLYYKFYAFDTLDVQSAVDFILKGELGFVVGVFLDCW